MFSSNLYSLSATLSSKTGKTELYNHLVSVLRPSSRQVRIEQANILVINKVCSASFRTRDKNPILGTQAAIFKITAVQRRETRASKNATKLLNNFLAVFFLIYCSLLCCKVLLTNWFRQIGSDSFCLFSDVSLKG